MKNLLVFVCFGLLILAVAITYLGLQRPHIFNPPVITGLGFVLIAFGFFGIIKKIFSSK